MVAESAAGENFSVFIISKSENPCSFKNVKHLPNKYVTPKNSWMNSQIFEDYFHKLGRKFHVDERKFAIIIDNCLSHPSMFNLKNTKLVFLSQNTT